MYCHYTPHSRVPCQHMPFLLHELARLVSCAITHQRHETTPWQSCFTKLKLNANVDRSTYRFGHAWISDNHPLQPSTSPPPSRVTIGRTAPSPIHHLYRSNFAPHQTPAYSTNLLANTTPTVKNGLNSISASLFRVRRTRQATDQGVGWHRESQKETLRECILSAKSGDMVSTSYLLFIGHVSSTLFIGERSVGRKEIGGVFTVDVTMPPIPRMLFLSLDVAHSILPPLSVKSCLFAQHFPNPSPVQYPALHWHHTICCSVACILKGTCYFATCSWQRSRPTF